MKGGPVSRWKLLSHDEKEIFLGYRVRCHAENNAVGITTLSQKKTSDMIVLVRPEAIVVTSSLNKLYPGGCDIMRPISLYFLFYVEEQI